MVWVKSDSELSKSRKFYDLVNRLKVRPEDAFWNLHHLWYWCSDQFPDGVMKDVSDLAIARSAQWLGEPKAFVEALVISGFIDRQPGQLKLHDWEQWIPEPIRSKVRRATEKRPEFDRNSTNSELSSSSSLLSFKTSGKEKTWELREEHVKKLQELYPAVNILETCKKAHFWTENNPKRIKTAKRMLQWLANVWCEKEQNNSFRSNNTSSYRPASPEVAKILKGWKILNSIPTSGIESDSWDKVQGPKNYPACQNLLDLFGEWGIAVEAMEYVYMSLKSKNLSCTLETIVKHSDRYREYKSKGVFA